MITVRPVTRARLMALAALAAACEESPSLPPLYRAEIESELDALELLARESALIPVRVTNRGHSTWSSREAPPTHVASHLLDSAGTVLEMDGRRAKIWPPAAPGERVEVQVAIRAPAELGRYLIEVDLVREGVTWFGQQGSPTLRLPLTVVAPPPRPPAALELERHEGTLAWWVADLPAVNAAQHFVTHTLHANRRELRTVNGSVHGFAAGVSYHEIWIRDSETVLPIGRYVAPEPYLRQWILEHLRRQDVDGALYDLIREQRHKRNTVAGDREAGLVVAASHLCDVIGFAWLGERVAGKSVLERLQSALRYHLTARREAASGLFTSGHVADWGDVASVRADRRATTLAAGDRLVVGTYNQAITVLACDALARMLTATGAVPAAEPWRQLAASTREAARRLLWDEERGYFRVHRHVGGGAHAGLREDEIFAMGGNSFAIRAGLATGDQAHRIIDTALARSAASGMPTISGTLLPPYPASFFSDPILDEPYEYQNGGQWDWFGGQLVLQMFRLARDEAQAELSKLAAQVAANGGFHEWYDREGEGRGSPLFAGGAAAFAQAVVRGLFGVEWVGEQVTVRPRLGLRDGYLYLPQAAGAKRFAYHWQVAPDRTSITLRLATNLETVVIELPRRVAERAVSLARVNGRVERSAQTSTAEGERVELRGPQGVVETVWKLGDAARR